MDARIIDAMIAFERERAREQDAHIAALNRSRDELAARCDRLADAIEVAYDAARRRTILREYTRASTRFHGVTDELRALGAHSL
jgi:hypothetical protein